jgi:WD40 repeat protein
VATASADNKVKIWSVIKASNWSLIQTFTQHTANVIGLEYINAQTIASGSYDATIKIWSIYTGLVNISITASAGVYCLQLLENGFYLAGGLINGKICIFDIKSGALIVTLNGQGQTNDLVLINGQFLASSSDDSKIRLWDLTTNTSKFILTGHTSNVYALKLVSADIIASGSLDKTIKLWNVTKGTLIRTLSNHIDEIFWSIDFFAKYQVIVSGSIDKTIKVWDVNTGSLIKTIDTNGFQMKSLALITIGTSELLF